MLWGSGGSSMPPALQTDQAALDQTVSLSTWTMRRFSTLADEIMKISVPYFTIRQQNRHLMAPVLKGELIYEENIRI